MGSHAETVRKRWRATGDGLEGWCCCGRGPWSVPFCCASALAPPGEERVEGQRDRKKEKKKRRRRR